MERPITTLFLLMSLDGKISTGATDALDVDSDLKNIEGVKEGLHQYYEIEQTTDLWSLNSGRVFAKIGINEAEKPKKGPVSFVAIDNTHLTERGIRNLISKSATFVLITSNPQHPAFHMKENVNIIFEKEGDLSHAFCQLLEKYGCERITVQSGGTLNAELVKAGLIDYVDLIVAPLFIGGKDTPTPLDGKSLMSKDELFLLTPLTLISSEVLEDSWIRLKYKVNH